MTSPCYERVSLSAARTKSDGPTAPPGNKLVPKQGPFAAEDLPRAPMHSVCKEHGFRSMRWKV